MKKVFFIASFLFVSSFVKAQTGIGTTSPINKFEVVATTADPATSGSSANGNVRLGPSSGSHVLDFGLSSTSTYAWLQARLKSNYGTNYNLVLNPNGGPVGIGNKSPSATLTVGNESGTIGGEILLNPTSTQYEGGQIILKRSLEGSTVDWTIDQYGTNTSNARFRIFNGASESNGIAILENGKIGIGTPSPTTLLHLQNGNVFSGSDDPATNTIPSLYVYNSNNASAFAHATSLVRTAGTGSGKPYYSLDINGAFGFSMGINNPNNQMIINTTWNFNTAAANNAITINRFGQSRVAIPEQGGQVATDWPGSWGGGIATYDFLAFGVLGNSFNTRSDHRLKNNIVDLDSSSISKYLTLRPVTFYWNQDKKRDTKLQYGFIAQEIESIFPEMVNTGTDEMQTKSVNYQALHALSLKVIQAQQAEIELLKKKQIEFEARLLRLEAKINN
jgi:hypothetical protein